MKNVKRRENDFINKIEKELIKIGYKTTHEIINKIEYGFIKEFNLRLIKIGNCNTEFNISELKENGHIDFTIKCVYGSDFDGFNKYYNEYEGLDDFNDCVEFKGEFFMSKGGSTGDFNIQTNYLYTETLIELKTLTKELTKFFNILEDNFDFYRINY